MTRLFDRSLFIFRRDLRLQDNTALINALVKSREVLPCFFLDPRLLEISKPHLNAIQFMIEALHDLKNQLQHNNSQLFLQASTPEVLLQEILTKFKINALFVNRDYSPFSRRRDANLRKICTEVDVVFHQFADSLLNEPEMIYTANNQPYKVFTPFFRKAIENAIRAPKHNAYTNFMKNTHKQSQKVTSLLKKFKPEYNEYLIAKGSRTAGMKILSNLQNWKEYNLSRDFPSQHGSTRLSAYIKFGICSIREVYHAIVNQLGATHPLIRQLYWRDFYTHIAFHYPHVFKGAFRPRYDKIQWNYDKNLFEVWSQGKTGFPIVDAGMRELNTTGWMHNRVRMIVASFLVKDLHIDWRWGERYFASKLVDYDPAVNNGNWQWAASTGVDAQPYFRIFNPWRQQEKYDSKCEYIKKWIPELSNLESKIIHRWYKSSNWDSTIEYPKPVVNHKEESQHSKELFSSTFSPS